MSKIGNIEADGNNLSVHVEQYAANQPKVVQIYDDEGPYCTLSVNIPGTQLAEDEFLIKTWSENESLRGPVLASGLFLDTGRRVQAGFAQAEVWMLVSGK
jgi:hypothetical protein